MEIKDILSMSRLDSEGLAEITQAFTEQKYRPKEIVFREGDPSDALYFIRSGRFLVAKRNQNGDDEPLGVLEEGQFFGEIGLLENMERTATVTALVDSEVFILDAATFGNLLEKSDAFTALLNDVAQKRLIKQVAIFRELDDQGLTDVQNLLKEKLFPEKTVIFKENDPSDALYIVVKGEVRISKRTQSEKDLTLTFLRQGDHFGELGLIDPQPRSATATTTEPSKLLVLTSSDFQSLKHNPVIAFNMLKIVSRRLREIDRELTLAKGTLFFKGITIISRPEKCLACRSCEIACAVSKSRTRDLFEAVYEEPPPIKRIHVRRIRDGSQPVIRPEHCLHCRDAPCLSKCKPGAIKRDPISGTIVILEEKCKGCGLCAKVCPFSVINMVRTEGLTRVALKCTQCVEHEAGPACVRACPTNALVISLATMPVA